MPKLKHYDNLGTARFITFSCYRRLPNFIRDYTCDIFIKQLNQAREKYHFLIYGYVIMPEHVHIVLHPLKEIRLGLVVREIKSKSAREYFRMQQFNLSGANRIFWQRRCYDHNCRSVKSVLEKINYCHKNPVVRGLVKDPCEWKWSSFDFYQGKKDVPLLIDKLQM